MKRECLLFTFCLCFYLTIFSQAPLVKQWDKRYGGSSEEFLTDYKQTSDGGYILGGYSGSSNTGDHSEVWRGGYDYWIVRIDSIGTKLWDKRFGGNGHDYLRSVEQTTDGGYILGGYSFSGIGGDKSQSNWNVNLGSSDYWIVKTDSLGNKQWDKRYGGAFEDYLYAVHQTADGGYILGGYVQPSSTGDISQFGRGHYDYWVVKTDSAGNMVWNKLYGGLYADRCYALEKTSDGGYILGGTSSSTVSGEKTQPCWGYEDYWMVKIAYNGVKQWDKRFGGSGDDNMFSVQQTRDGGYLLGGYCRQTTTNGDHTEPPWVDSMFWTALKDYWVVKTDSIGNKIWDKRYGGTYDEGYIAKAFETSDGGILAVGSSESTMSGDKSEVNAGPKQTWVLKADANGIKQWDKTIFTAGIDKNGLAIQTRDGCYVFANNTSGGVAGYKTQPSQGIEDYWIIKFCDSTDICFSDKVSIAANNDVFCGSDSAQICCATLTYSNYHWSTGETTGCITTSLAGNYYVTVTDNNGCTAQSNAVAIAAYPAPAVSISGNGDTLSSIGGVAYQWYRNGVEINGATAETYVVVEGGTYSLELIDSNGCSAFSSSVVFSGIETMQRYSIAVYPNPASTQLNIEIDETLIGAQLNIYDVTGALLRSTKLESVNSKLETANYSRGIYIAEIKLKDVLQRVKWVKM